MSVFLELSEASIKAWTMGKRGVSYIIIIITVLGILMFVQYNAPKQLNWFESYVGHHKIPYGTKVIKDLLAKRYGDRMGTVTKPPYAFLQQSDTIQGTYLFVNRSLRFEKAELHRLLDWTANGNTLFLAANAIDVKLEDTLGLRIDGWYPSSEISEKRYLPSWVAPSLRTTDTTLFDRTSSVHVITPKDSVPMMALGEISLRGTSASGEDARKINIIQKEFGKGRIILSSFPEGFTNYFLLTDGNKEYTQALLGKLRSPGRLYWDAYHKAGKTIYTSPMYIFLNTKELKWAYYMALIGVVIYVLFEGKRKQRAIPVLSPKKNQTMAFTRTIADMYYENQTMEPLPNTASHILWNICVRIIIWEA